MIRTYGRSGTDSSDRSMARIARETGDILRLKTHAYPGAHDVHRLKIIKNPGKKSITKKLAKASKFDNPPKERRGKQEPKTKINNGRQLKET